MSEDYDCWTCRYMTIVSERWKEYKCNRTGDDLERMDGCDKWEERHGEKGD